MKRNARVDYGRKAGIVLENPWTGFQRRAVISTPVTSGAPREGSEVVARGHVTPSLPRVKQRPPNWPPKLATKLAVSQLKVESHIARVRGVPGILSLSLSLSPPCPTPANPTTPATPATPPPPEKSKRGGRFGTGIPAPGPHQIHE